ncbi:MAG: HRDC domain-containing protein [bacterium]
MSAVKLFRIRIDDVKAPEDEAFLNAFLEAVRVLEVRSSLMNGPSESFWSVFVHYEELDEENRPESGAKLLFDAAEPLLPEEENQYFRLRVWREREAERRAVPAYLIVHSGFLRTLAKVQPKTLDEMRRIQGLSRKRIEEYGETWLQILRSESSDSAQG